MYLIFNSFNYKKSTNFNFKFKLKFKLKIQKVFVTYYNKFNHSIVCVLFFYSNLSFNLFK